jgi:hypothetical protein
MHDQSNGSVHNAVPVFHLESSISVVNAQVKETGPDDGLSVVKVSAGAVQVAMTPAVALHLCRMVALSLGHMVENTSPDVIGVDPYRMLQELTCVRAVIEEAEQKIECACGMHDFDDDDDDGLSVD